MLELLKQPWHWAVSGVLIGLTVPLLLLLGNKKFGISSSLRHVCAACFPANIPFFNYDWKKHSWNLLFVVGIAIGGFIATTFLHSDAPLNIAEDTQNALSAYGITVTDALLPTEIFSWDNLFSLKGLVFFMIGGFLVGFGTRYAGGCTSGHAIMGLSNLQWPSLVATICFMIGGIFSTWVLLPYLLKLM